MKKPNKKQVERYRIIETLARWEGVINASVLGHFIGITPRNATTEIQAYNEYVAVPLEYNASRKLFVAPKAFKPIFISDDWGLYHEHLLRFTELYKNVFWQKNALEMMPNGFNHVDPEVTKVIHECIKNSSSFKAKYHSMSSPRGATRTLHPHAIAYDGVRWHMRAYSEEHGEFRDFNLSRISSPNVLKSSEIDRLEDNDWHNIVTLKLSGHPELNEHQQKLVLSDYGQKRPFEYSIRAAMVKYFVKYYPIATNLDESPFEKPLYLSNSQELSEYLLGS